MSDPDCPVFRACSLSGGCSQTDHKECLLFLNLMSSGRGHPRRRVIVQISPSSSRSWRSRE